MKSKYLNSTLKRRVEKKQYIKEDPSGNMDEFLENNENKINFKIEYFCISWLDIQDFNKLYYHFQPSINLLILSSLDHELSRERILWVNHLISVVSWTNSFFFHIIITITWIYPHPNPIPSNLDKKATWLTTLKKLNFYFGIFLN